jgi:predicted AAA+ superfamily ATPase
MAITNHERVGKALELLKTGLVPFIERELKTKYGDDWAFEVRDILTDTRLGTGKNESLQDVAASLVVMDRKWGDVFRQILGKTERSLVNELLAVRNSWAHQEAFSSDDAYRALDSAARLLTAISAAQASEVEKMKTELLRVRFDEQARGEKRKSAGTAIESGVTGSLKPWREVVMPHEDVASGRYQQAEFAADLWQVHLGEGTPEYKNPVEFFRRTYLTASLTEMLVGAVRRLTVGGGDPVVQLQTNFGGGKTHSMLALYHLFSGIAPTDLPGVDTIMQAAGAKGALKAQRVVLVGNKISPGNPSTKPDGTVVRTLWGELAWQLGGKKAFARVQADDENATSPGDVLRELFNDYGPCLILVDEWVAYARQLHDQSDLPAGGFETQFTFAQLLTESAKLAKNCLLVISLPASDTSGHSHSDDVEVGGTRGREALDRLRNVVGRVESSWRPASAEEGFEIVRRRLFQPLADQAFKDRDVVARAFADFYRTQQAEFPPECRESEYEQRIKAAYPIHPEIFDRLYNDWSTLVKFQRTRGVLRLMAAVIHSLWEKGDRNPLILPANVSIDDARVQSELTRYLSDNWVPVIEKDVDGPNSLPLKLDSELPNLGKFSACRRVARAIYLGSAPTTAAAHKGIEDRRVKLGCVMPGESPAVFGDALRRMAGAATYLYQDGSHYWYSTQPTVTKLAEDRAEQMKREPDKVAHELEQRLRRDLARTGDFPRIHPMPASGADVPDDFDARLVVLGVNHPYSRDGGSAAELVAKAILENRGNTPRLYRNTLVFLAADKTRLQDLDEAARKFLAWRSILDEQKNLNLTPYQVTQAETQKGVGRQHRHRTPARDLSMVTGTGAGNTAGGDHLGGAAPAGTGRSRRAREQEAAHRRALPDQLCPDAPEDGARQDSALARQSCGRETTGRRLRTLPLPAPAQGFWRVARCHPRWREPAYLDAGQLCCCRQFRRGRRSLQGAARWHDGDAGRRACAGSGGEARCGQEAAGGRACCTTGQWGVGAVACRRNRRNSISRAGHKPARRLNPTGDSEAKALPRHGDPRDSTGRTRRQPDCR